VWDLFDFNSDGKVSLEEKVLGAAIVEELLFSDDNDRIEDIDEDVEEDNFDSDDGDDDEI
jgi:hypothetical protein